MGDPSGHELGKQFEYLTVEFDVEFDAMLYE